MKLRYLFAAAALAAGTPVIAGDDVVALGRYQPPAGGFAGAVQTAAANEMDHEDDDDTVLTHGYRRSYYGYRGGYSRAFYRGYRGGYGGAYYGYRGGYVGFSSFGGGFGYGYRSYSYYPRYYGASYYRPYYVSSYYRPYVVASSPTYYVSSYPTTSVVAAPRPTPTVINNYYYSTPAPSTALTPPRPMIPPADSAAPKYDGGPMNPVPQPKPDATPPAPADNTNVKISSKPANKYPAYGEK